MHRYIQQKICCVKKLIHYTLSRRNKLYENIDLISFSFLAALEHFVVFIIVYLMLDMALSIGERSTVFDKIPAAKLFAMAVLIGPIIETIIFQFAIIELLKKKISDTFTCGFVSAIIFGFGHISNSQYSIYFATIGGLYLSWGYNHWAAQSRSKAIISTASQHAIFNLIVYTVDHY